MLKIYSLDIYLKLLSVYLRKLTPVVIGLLLGIMITGCNTDKPKADAVEPGIPSCLVEEYRHYSGVGEVRICKDIRYVDRDVYITTAIDGRGIAMTIAVVDNANNKKRGEW